MQKYSKTLNIFQQLFDSSDNLFNVLTVTVRSSAWIFKSNGLVSNLTEGSTLRIRWINKSFNMTNPAATPKY